MEGTITTGFDGAVVLVTGAAGSLGRAQCEAFARAGAAVIALDLPARAEEGAALAAGLPGGRGRWVAHDIGDLAASEALAARLASEHGRMDVLVNNAALIMHRPWDAFSYEEYEAQIRVNSSAAYALVRGVAPSMKARGSGAIVNLCSITLNGRWDGYTPYVASKGALLGLTKGLARELGPHGIRVNAVSPGAVVSDAEARVFGDRAEAYDAWVRESQSLKTRIVPEDIANAIVFLASPAARMISGANLPVDGGW